MTRHAFDAPTPNRLCTRCHKDQTHRDHVPLPEERRTTAIVRLMDEMISRETGQFHLENDEITDDVIETFAAKIVDTLPMLGRTERWKGACKQWAYMVRDAKSAPDKPRRLHWAICQGSLYMDWANR